MRFALSQIGVAAAAVAVAASSLSFDRASAVNGDEAAAAAEGAEVAEVAEAAERMASALLEQSADFFSFMKSVLDEVEKEAAERLEDVEKEAAEGLEGGEATEEALTRLLVGQEVEAATESSEAKEQEATARRVEARAAEEAVERRLAEGAPPPNPGPAPSIPAPTTDPANPAPAVPSDPAGGSSRKGLYIGGGVALAAILVGIIYTYLSSSSTSAEIAEATTTETPESGSDNVTVE